MEPTRKPYCPGWGYYVPRYELTCSVYSMHLFALHYSKQINWPIDQIREHQKRQLPVRYNLFFLGSLKSFFDNVSWKDIFNTNYWPEEILLNANITCSIKIFSIPKFIDLHFYKFLPGISVYYDLRTFLEKTISPCYSFKKIKREKVNARALDCHTLQVIKLSIVKTEKDK